MRTIQPITSILLVLRLPLVGALSAQNPTPALLISNVRVLDARAGRFSAPQQILIRNGRIIQLGAAVTAESPTSQVDARGAYAIPGLWDSHVHLSPLTLRGGDTLAATLEAFARNGVLYVRDVGGPLNVMAELSRRIASGTLRGPTIFFGGPMAERPPLYWANLNSMLPGFTVPIETEAGIDSLVTSIVEAGGTHVKVFGKWDRNLFRRLRSRALDRSLAIVVDPGFPFFQDLPVDTLLALRGVSSIEHGHSPWQSILRPELRRRMDSLAAPKPDSIGRRELLRQVMDLGTDSFDPAILGRLAETWRKSGIFFSPTLRPMEQLRRNTPPLPFARSAEERARYWNAWADAAAAIVKAVAAQGVPLLVGQDEMEPVGTFEEMELLAQAGIRPADVLRAATLHPAQALRQEADLGTIDVGKSADIVLLRENPLESLTHLRSPWLVLKRGEVIYRRD